MSTLHCVRLLGLHAEPALGGCAPDLGVHSEVCGPAELAVTTHLIACWQNLPAMSHMRACDAMLQSRHAVSRAAAHLDLTRAAQHAEAAVSPSVQHLPVFGTL